MTSTISRLLLFLAVLLAAGHSSASPVSIIMVLEDPDGPLHVSNPGTSLYDPSNLTMLTSGITFKILVDSTTPDARPDLDDYGRFLATEVRMTASDLGVFDELVTTPLGYFEDDTLERAGISPIGDFASVQVGFSTAGNGQVGDPNVIDTLVDFTGDPVFSIWSNAFVVELASGLRIAADPTSPLVNFATSSISAQSVPTPTTILFLTFAIVALFARYHGKDAATNRQSR